jgi:hypothetical protein
MSYARFIEGDVYVYGTHLGKDEAGNPIEGFTCCGCWMIDVEWVETPTSILGGFIRAKDGGPTSYSTTSRGEMIAHLHKHTKAGHTVPDRAFEGLAEEEEWGEP